MFKGEGYVRQLPDLPRNLNELILIKENVRKVFTPSLDAAFLDSDLQTAAFYCEFLAQLDPTGHYNYLWLGIVNLEFRKKRDSYEKP